MLKVLLNACLELVARITNLKSEVADLKEKLSASEAEKTEAVALAEQLKIQLEDIVAKFDPSANG